MYTAVLGFSLYDFLKTTNYNKHNYTINKNDEILGHIPLRMSVLVNNFFSGKQTKERLL